MEHCTQAKNQKLAMNVHGHNTIRRQLCQRIRTRNIFWFSGAMQRRMDKRSGQMATGQDASGNEYSTASVVTFAQNLMPMVTSVLTQLPKLIVTLHWLNRSAARRTFGKQTTAATACAVFADFQLLFMTSIISTAFR